MDTSDQDQQTQQKMQDARNSFSGKRLTDNQFNESWAISAVMESTIRESGSFRDKLTDYAHAFSRTERFDTMRGEDIIRDVFKARYGQTMNQMREHLMQRQGEIGATGSDLALEHAHQIEPTIRNGDTMPFYQAYDRAAGQLAQTLGITRTGAKEMMKEAYQATERRDLYETSKAVEDQYHRPKIEAERASREATRDRTRSMQRSP